MRFETSGRNRRTRHNEENEQRDVGSGRKESTLSSVAEELNLTCEEGEAAEFNQ